MKSTLKNMSTIFAIFSGLYGRLVSTARPVGGNAKKPWNKDLAGSYVVTRSSIGLCRPSDKAVLCRVETRWVYVDLNEHVVVAIPDEQKSQMTVVPSIPSLPWENDDVR